MSDCRSWWKSPKPIITIGKYVLIPDVQGLLTDFGIGKLLGGQWVLDGTD